METHHIWYDFGKILEHFRDASPNKSCNFRGVWLGSSAVRATKVELGFSRMRSKGSRFTLGVWGLRVCSLDVAFTVATVRNRPQPSATVRTNSVWPCLWEVLQRWSFLEVSDVSLLRFAWQAWHFVTFRRVLQRVESRFTWQAQYFCDIFRRCVAVFVAGAALWTCASSFFVAGAPL